jgi:ABC-type protease/lipase transport system fused ATPase/permease subunit
MLSTPLFSMQVLDRVLGSQNTDTLLMLTLVIILALALLGLIQAARAFAMNKMGSWLEDKLSEVVFSNSIKLALESKAMANSQPLRDLQTVKTFLTSPGLISIMDMPWAIIFIIVFSLKNPNQQLIVSSVYSINIYRLLKSNILQNKEFAKVMGNRTTYLEAMKTGATQSYIITSESPSLSEEQNLINRYKIAVEYLLS